MNASSFGLAAIILLPLLPIHSARAGEVAIVRPHGWAHAGPGSRGPEFARDERRFSREADARFHHGRRNSDGDAGGDWGGYYGDGNDEGPVAEAAAPQFFASPSFNITITLAPPAAPGQAAPPAHAAAAGPRIITIGAVEASSKFATMPIVVYGRSPIGETD
jgi:hypothetical protein